MAATADHHCDPVPHPARAPDFTAGTLDVPAEAAPETAAGEPEVLGPRRSPLRRCIASGRVQGKDLMVRFVVGPDGTLVPDVAETLPGKGLWLTADREVVEKALAKKLFARAARRTVTAAPDLRDRLTLLLRRRALDLLGLAARGGGVVAGFEKVQAALRSGRLAPRSPHVPGLWLEAVDGAADGRAKLAPLASARGLAPVAAFDRAELGAALGRDMAVHVLLAAGPLADGLGRELRRMTGVTEGLPPAEQEGGNAMPPGPG